MQNKVIKAMYDAIDDHTELLQQFGYEKYINDGLPILIEFLIVKIVE